MKTFGFLLLGLIAFGCKEPEKKAIGDSEKPAEKKAIVNEDPVGFYKAYIKKLDTADVASVSKAAKQYVELFGKTDTVKADSGFVTFSRFYDKITEVANDQHIKDPNNYAAYVQKNSKKQESAAANERVKKLKENGLTIDMSEGSTFIRQDGNFLSGYFYPYVSSAMKDYLVEVNKENEEGLVEDAGLVITPTQLAKRILFWENFIKQHPSFVFSPEIKETQRGNITFLLEGIDNTPLLDRNTQTVSKKFKEAFDHILKDHPDSNIAATLKPYYEALEQKNIKKAEKLLLQYKKQNIIYDYSS